MDCTEVYVFASLPRVCLDEWEFVLSSSLSLSLDVVVCSLSSLFFVFYLFFFLFCVSPSPPQKEKIDLLLSRWKSRFLCFLSAKEGGKRNQNYFFLIKSLIYTHTRNNKHVCCFDFIHVRWRESFRRENYHRLQESRVLRSSERERTEEGTNSDFVFFLFFLYA